MKRIVTVQDISCAGKCSLTVALPIISAMGVEAAIIPTAVLSTHTMFKGFTFCDLTAEVEPITAHWKKEGFTFDALYTGYLGSFEQIDLMKKMFSDFKTEDNFTFVDPAMGDNGKLYPAFDESFAKKMSTLCGVADIIVPNITEACFMTDIQYKETYDEDYVKELLSALSGLGAKVSIITGVSLSEGKTGFMGYDREKKEYFSFQHDKLASSYHGTGDIFSSTCVGALTRGYSYLEAAKIAALYTAECIRLTMEDGLLQHYGVHFEQAVPYLLDLINE